MHFDSEILSLVEHAVIVTDPDGIITDWNQVAERLYGWTRAEVIGKSIVTITPGDGHLAAAEEIMEKLRRGESWGGRFPVRRKDGTEFEAFVIDAPIMRDGVLQGIVGISIASPSAGAEPNHLWSSLTPREKEVLKLTAEGKTRGDVAHILGISKRTVESHRQNIYRKLNLRTRTDLMIFALRHGLLTLDE